MTGKRVPDGTEPHLYEPGDYGRWKDEWFIRCPIDTEHRMTGNLSSHDVVEHEDGTITVSPSILDIGYADACSLIEASPTHGRGDDWETGGTNHMALDHVLQQHGFWWQRTYRAWESEGNWPPEPWAPIHLCQVEQPSRNAHFVVMDAWGVVLDPLREGEYRLADWPDVMNVAGLVKP